MTSREPGISRVTGHVDESNSWSTPASLTASGVDSTNGRRRPRGGRHRVARAPPGAVVPAAPRGGRLRPGYATRLPPAPRRGAGSAERGSRVRLRAPGLPARIFEHDAGTFTVLVVRGSEGRRAAALRDAFVRRRAAGTAAGSGRVDGPGAVVPDRPRASRDRALLRTTGRSHRRARAARRRRNAVCTSNPSGARGVSLGLESPAALADVVVEFAVRRRGDGARRLVRVAVASRRSRTTVVSTRRSRRVGGSTPLDPEGPIGSDTVAAAAQRRPWFMPVSAVLRHAGVAGTAARRARRCGTAARRLATAGSAGRARDDLVAALASVGSRQWWRRGRGLIGGPYVLRAVSAQLQKLRWSRQPRAATPPSPTIPTVGVTGPDATGAADVTPGKARRLPSPRQAVRDAAHGVPALRRPVPRPGSRGDGVHAAGAQLAACLERGRAGCLRTRTLLVAYLDHRRRRFPGRWCRTWCHSPPVLGNADTDDRSVVVLRVLGGPVGGADGRAPRHRARNRQNETPKALDKLRSDPGIGALVAQSSRPGARLAGVVGTLEKECLT